MRPIFKTWKSRTYFKGFFELRSESENWAHPISFPTVFVAYGHAVKSGNWNSSTSINTPKYVIDNFFDGIGKSKHDSMFLLWEFCDKLSKLDRKTAYENIQDTNELIWSANNELSKLTKLQ